MQSWMFWFKAVKWIYKSMFLLHDILDFLLSCQIIQSYQICSFQIKFCHRKKYFLSWRKKTNSLGPFKFWKWELFTLFKLVWYKVVTAEHSGRMKAIVHYYSDAYVYELIYPSLAQGYNGTKRIWFICNGTWNHLAKCSMSSIHPK